MSAQTSRESAHLLESWWRRLEPRSGDKRRVFEDELEDRSIGHRAGERRRRGDDLVVLRERGGECRMGGSRRRGHDVRNPARAAGYICAGSTVAAVGGAYTAGSTWSTRSAAPSSCPLG